MNYLTLILAVFVISGCQTTQVNALPGSMQRPAWVQSPERTGFISVVGFAPKQSPADSSAQYRIAMIKAERELAQMVRVRVASISEQSLIESKGSVTTSYNDSKKLSTNTAISITNAKVTATWTDPADQGLYVLVEIPE